MRPPKFAFGTVIVWAAVHALAQVPQEFPPNATSISADQLKARLIDRVFTARMTDGKDWRWEWKSNGYIFFNTSSGYNDSGKWRTEDGKVCVEMIKSGASCSDMRMVGDVLYLKRASNGEVIGLQPN